MAKNIGEVEFIVNFDGKKLPVQARELAKKIGEAGGEAGDKFSNEFEKTYNKRMSDLGKSAANQLGDRGKLAGDRFANDFDREVQGKFRRTQQDLAKILSDKDAFRDFAKGFETTSDAVTQLENDLQALRDQEIHVRDEQGNMQRELVLTQDEMKRFRTAAHDMGLELEATREKERVFAEQQRDLEVRLGRVFSVLENDDAWRKHIDEIGSADFAYQELHDEIERLAPALNKVGDSASRWQSRLVQVRDSVIETDARMRELTKEPNALQRAFDSAFGSIRTSFARMDSTVRAVILLIAGAGDQIAALGSALGAGTFALGAGLAQLVTAGLGVYSVFKTLQADSGDFNDQMKEVVASWTEFKNQLKQTQTLIGATAFTHLTLSFSELEGSVRALSPELVLLGHSIGSITSQFADGVRPGTAAFEELQQLIVNTAQDMPKLAAATGLFGTALLRGVNRAEPLFQDLLGWIDKIATRFDDFTRSNGFLTWITNAQTIFHSLSGLLDSVGRGLNDLATPQSVKQVSDLLDNVSGFVPVLTRMLQVVGTLNPLGLLAKALNDVGQAIDPLLGPLNTLASALSGSLESAIQGVSSVLTPLSQALAPIVQAFANLIALIPPPLLEAMAAGLTALGVGMAAVAAVKGLDVLAFRFGAVANAGRTMVAVFSSVASSQGIGTAISAVSAELLGLNTSVGKTTTSVKGLGSAIQGLSFGSKAGIFGLFIASGVAAGSMISDLINKIADYSGKAQAAVDANKGLVASTQSIFQPIQYLGAQLQGTSLNADNLHGALARMTQENANGGEFWASWTIGASDFGNAAHDLRSTLSQLDAPLASLAATNLTAASAQFAQYAQAADATREQVLAMINQMPAFKAALEQQAAAQGLVASSSNLVDLALQGQTQSQIDANAAAADAQAQLDALGGQSVATSQQVTGLADAIKGFGSATLTARDAARAYQASIDDASAAIAKNGAALQKGRNEFDINTAAGRANQAAIDAIASSTLKNAAAIYTQTGRQDLATAAIARGRDAVVSMLTPLFKSRTAAEAYAKKLGLIPDNVSTFIQVKGVAQAEAQINQVARDRTVDLYLNTQLGGGGRLSPGGSGNGGTAHASGTITNGPEVALIGEAGREAVVPLERPLSQVDPSVRALAAFARGIMPTRAMAAGGIAGGQVTIMPGSVQVIGSLDPRRTALETVDRLVEVMSS